MLYLLKNGIWDSENIVSFAYCSYTAAAILQSTQFNNVPGWDTFYWLLHFFVILASAVSIHIGQAIPLHKQMVIVGVLFVGLAASVMSGRWTEILPIALFVLGGVNIHSDEPFRLYLYTVIAVVLMTLLLYAVGIYQYDVFLQGGRVRLYLGFTFTTYLPNYFFHALLIYFIVKRKPIDILDTSVILFINWIIMQCTATRAVYYEVYLLLLLEWGLRVFPGLYKNILFSAGSILTMPIAAVVSIYVSSIYDPTNELLVLLDQKLTYRLQLGKTAISEYGFSPFGQITQWVTGRLGVERTTDYFYVDCAYVNIAITYGVIILILVVLGFMYLGWRANAERKYILSISLLMVAVHSITDPQLFQLQYDPFLILIGSAVLSGMSLPIWQMDEQRA